MKINQKRYEEGKTISLVNLNNKKISLLIEDFNKIKSKEFIKIFGKFESFKGFNSERIFRVGSIWTFTNDDETATIYCLGKLNSNRTWEFHQNSNELAVLSLFDEICERIEPIYQFLEAYAKSMEWTEVGFNAIATKLCQEGYYAPETPEDQTGRRFLLICYGWIWGKSTDKFPDIVANCKTAVLQFKLNEVYRSIVP